MIKIKLFALLLICVSCTIYHPQKDDESYKVIGNFPTSAEDYENLKNYIIAHPNTEDSFVALQRYIKNDIDEKKYSDAIKKIQQNERYFSSIKPKLQQLIKILLEPESNLKKKVLPGTINTNYDEYSPVLSYDDKWLYFVSEGKEDGIGYEDIYKSEIDSLKFGNGINLGLPINTTNNEVMTSISTDGTQFCLFGVYPCKFTNGNLYWSTLTNKGWTTPLPFNAPINSNDWDGDGFFTSDGNAFIFTSDRPGNIGNYVTKETKFHGSEGGNTDMYVCIKTGNGWSEPINLGKSINTPFTERKPFLHPDGKTLYFSSDGHAGLGRLDVFKTTKISESSWTDWSEPQNLGKEINSSDDDYGYKITTDGSNAYFAARNFSDNPPNFDIYSVPLPQVAKPEEVFSISGKVTDENGNPLDAELIWEDVSARKQIGKLNSNPITGEYFLVVPFGKKIGYYATRQGYYETSNYIDLSTKKKTDKVRQDIILISIKKMIEEGQTVRLNNIFFDYDKFELKEESFPELDRLLKMLNENPGVKVQINAHTDDQGSDLYNNKLSENRAKSVIDYLALKGIVKERLKSVGFGEKKPIATNETEEGRAQNRRVEFQFIK